MLFLPCVNRDKRLFIHPLIVKSSNNNYAYSDFILNNSDLSVTYTHIICADAWLLSNNNTFMKNNQHNVITITQLQERNRFTRSKYLYQI